MKKLTCVILGLAALAMGILGLTGLVPMFKADLIVNISEIALGALGFLVGVYSPQYSVNKSQAAATANLQEDNHAQQRNLDNQRKDIDQQRKELDVQRKDIDVQRKEFDVQSKELDQQIK